MAKKTLAEHLQQASLLFGAGDVVRAGQIWQAILKIHPSNPEAKAGLLKVKDILSKTPADSLDGPIGPGTPKGVDAAEQTRETWSVEPAPPEGQGRPDAELLMKQGRAHYDQGSLQEALEAWEKALEMDPSNNLALSYARGVRKELGLPIPETMRAPQDPPSLLSPAKADPSEPADRAPDGPASEKAGRLPNDGPNETNGTGPAQAAKREDGATNDAAGNNRQPEDIASRIERGSQLYKAGKIAEAIAAWESVLSMWPSSALIQGYLAMAREDLASQRKPAPEGVLQKKNEALSEYAPFDFGRPSGAPPTGLADGPEAVPPGNNARPPAPKAHDAWVAADVKGGAPVDGGGRAPDQRRPPKPIGPTGPAGPSKEGAPTKMPAMIVEKQPQNRQGPSLPKKLHGLPFLSRLLTPTAIKAACLLIFVSAAAGAWFAWAKRDALMRATKAAIVGEAIKTANQSIKAVGLGQSADELRSEAKTAMSSDPLRAYLLVQELIGRDPNDTSPAKMLEQARQAMAEAPKAKVDGDLSRLLSAEAFDDAEALLKSMLMQNPNNMRARENLARVCLIRARHLIANGQWGKARSSLLMGAALYPRDPSWEARLKFLENIQSSPREDHVRWAEMLG